MTITPTKESITIVAKEAEPHTYRCEACNQAFRMQTHLKIHKCVPRKNISCDLCQDLKFLTIEELQQHLKMHAKDYFGADLNKTMPNADNQCDICGKSLSTKQTLKKHKLYFHSGQNFTCTHCNKNFATKGYLTRHEKTHTRDMPSFFCKDCDKVFTRKPLYISHMAIHENKEGKPMHDCPKCGKSFSQKYNMNKHLKTHSKTTS